MITHEFHTIYSFCFSEIVLVLVCLYYLFFCLQAPFVFKISILYVPDGSHMISIYILFCPTMRKLLKFRWFLFHFYLPRYISIILSWSTYSKIWGASIRIPTVPAVVTIKNIYNWSLSITIATYFQSSRVWKNGNHKLFNNNKRQENIS